MTKCLQCIILVKDCPGKQVQILYEPVAVRHKTAPARQTDRKRAAAKYRLLT